MPIDPRILLTALPLLALGACFDPTVDLGDGDGSATDASSTGTSSTDATGSTTDTDTDSAEGNADSTGANDAPPVITAFTLNGSTMPQEQQTAGMLAFDVDATDDVGIDRIEIYDGEVLVATVTEAPYVAEILVSSADNGSHSYSAVAYDGVGQTDESDTVPLSVNVIGGEILELREDIAEVSMALYMGVPRVVVDGTGDVFVTLTTTPDLLEHYHSRALSYSSTLSLLWESNLNPFGSSGSSFSHPIVTEGGELLVGGLHPSTTDADPTMTLYRADVGTGEPSSPQEFASTAGNIVFPVVAQLLSGDLVLATQPNVLEALSPDFTSSSWSQEQFPAPLDDAGDLGMVGIDVDGAGNLLLTFTSFEPSCGQDVYGCIRKLAPDGTTLWTRPASSTGNFSLTPARFDQDGRAIYVWAGGDDGVVADIHDPDGMLVTSIVALPGEQVTATDLTIDGQGNLLVTGYLRDGVGTAWAARISATGDVIWSQYYDELGETDSLVGGVAVSSDGRTYLVGASELRVPGFLQLEGSVWVAEIQL